MIAAAIDIGTNSVKLVVGKKTNAGRKILYDGTRVTRLGQGVDAAGTLHPDAIARTLDALEELGGIARRHRATRIAAVGTSALRDAADGPDFAKRASEILGGPVEIIRGEREAELTFAAVTGDPGLRLFPPITGDQGATGGQEAEIIATDIGGGSAEVVLGDASRIRFATSLQLGAVRLTERVKPSDPWTPEDLARAESLVEEALIGLPSSAPDATFVACGGTAANLARMVRASVHEPIEPEKIHGSSLSDESLGLWIERLAALPLAERKTVPGLEPARAEVIVAGAVIQRAILRHFQLDALTVSARGLRYGLLYTLLKDETKP